VPGGTGETFDWSIIPSSRTWRLVLAGGLETSNVHAAVQQVAPWAVDVSGGVELSKGIKDSQKINAFIEEVKRG
jgi:phosphoribosylanthranilate isomerase